ncbi:MAG: type II toxin-antitoxin system VapC family toxin [Candidatus Micrarchaeota archaeon]|nr:type II toxin-antitoxin system VapC family toxin [Candidatus Micrarchaeota archaeon]
MEAALIYIDATILEAAALSLTVEGDAARKLLFANPTVATSTLSFYDLLASISKKAGKDQAIWMCEKYASLPNLSILQSSRHVALQAIENYKSTTLTPGKAMHLAYMQVNGINQIASLDSDFDKVKRIKRVKL